MMEKKEEEQKVTLNVGSFDQPNRNGVVYSRRAMEGAIDAALKAVEDGHPSKLFPDGKIPNFEQFLRMIAPNLSEDKIRLMVAMSERMPKYPDITARYRHGQDLFDCVKARMRDGGAVTRNLILVGQPRVGNWEKELAELGLERTEADVEITMAPRMVDGQVISYDVIKGRAGHPDALKVEIDSLPDWLRNVDLPLAPVDRDVGSQYGTRLSEDGVSRKLRESLDRLDGGVRTMSLNVPEPSFGTSRGCRRLLNTFTHSRQRAGGDITVNGKQRKELVTNANGTMTYPRVKQKFGRR